MQTHSTAQHSTAQHSTAQHGDLTFAIVTSTIGRPELEQAILSVQNQTYPAKHYVFVDGKEHWQQAGEILKKFPNVVPIYLPMNTGKNGWINSRINGISPFLVEEDIICFLDDDNFYELNHIETLANTFYQTNADWVYCLRNFIRMDSSFICQDITESIGFYHYNPPQLTTFEFEGLRINMNVAYAPMIDTNNYAFRNQLARRLVFAWNAQGFCNDRVVFNSLKNEQSLKYACTNSFTVNYRINPKTFGQGVDWNSLSQIFSDSTKVEEAIYMSVATWNARSQMIKT